MITTYGCICIILKRGAIKNKELIEEWIRSGRIEEGRFDEHLVCFFAGMNPWTAKRAGDILSERLGVEIYDNNNPYEPIAKDGVYEETMGGLCACCNWLRKEEGWHKYSYVPESERHPITVSEYDPTKDMVVRDFGEYNGQKLLLMENGYEIYLKLGTDRYSLFLPDDEVGVLIARGISKDDAALFLENEDEFYNLMDKRIKKEWKLIAERRIFFDVGDSSIGHLYIAKGKYANYIRCVSGKENRNFKLPKEYWFDENLCKTLSVETVLSFIKTNRNRDGYGNT